MFTNIFKHVQLKTYSEAIVETVLSCHDISPGKVQELGFYNFAEEIFMWLNLPPLYILEVSFISLVLQKLLLEKEFHRKLDGTSWQKLNHFL